MAVNPIPNRYDLVYLFDVSDGNPNGDPDAGNMPRMDPEDNMGLTSDVSIKRKIRNYVQMAKKESDGYQIYVKEKAVLNKLNEQAREKLLGKEKPDDLKKLPKDEDKAKNLVSYMCSKYYDIRTFGAVMSTGVNCGQVRGPVQFSFARSIDPILPMEITITRMAVTKKEDAEKGQTMGKKHIVTYALYRAHAHISANLADQSGFSEDDLHLLWNALLGMHDHDHSATRGEMGPRGLVIFKHDSAIGNAPARQLLERIKIKKVEGGAPRSYEDYRKNIVIDESNMPDGVKIDIKLDPRT
ncbi:MAG: type I-C CRISPR-associated protein Cas7/Csd2 [Cenarchaeum symbiont of Oopsacas minuta]|nr:type I-C CRISPR-associated protein Cas7/Csd2 [Cenarchaeum symbiont of Oopsacas minuta]